MMFGFYLAQYSNSYIGPEIYRVLFSKIELKEAGITANLPTEVLAIYRERVVLAI